MELNSVIAAVGKMFPNLNLNPAVQKAQEAISGTEDNFSSVSAAAKRLGLNRQSVESIYQKYGNTLHGRAVCGLLGTTPEALREDAEKILGGNSTLPGRQGNASGTSPKFPRLK